MKRLLRQIFEKLGIDISGVKHWFNVLWKYKIPAKEWVKGKDGYELKLLNITVKDKDSPLIRGYEFAKKIVVFGKGKFTYTDSQQLVLDIRGVRFVISDPEELFIVHEVFLEECYNYVTNDSTNQTVVIDIGLNVGITSLYFASRPQVQRVYAFELFPQTYELALRNIRLNDFGKKIIAANAGLGKSDETLTLDYSPQQKGRMGVSGLPKDDRYNDVIRQAVRLEDVSNVFQKLGEENRQSNIICKMDCEGAEYDILERLFETGSVKAANSYLIEWHYKDTSQIESQFVTNGFKIIKSTFPSMNSGMIYAFQ